MYEDYDYNDIDRHLNDIINGVTSSYDIQDLLDRIVFLYETGQINKIEYDELTNIILIIN